MTMVVVEGAHTHARGGTAVYYRYRYHRRAAGIAYEVDIGLNEAKSRLMSGLIAWNLRSLLFPRGLIERTIFKTIDMFEIEDIRTKF